MDDSTRRLRDHRRPEPAGVVAGASPGRPISSPWRVRANFGLVGAVGTGGRGGPPRLSSPCRVWANFGLVGRWGRVAVAGPRLSSPCRVRANFGLVGRGSGQDSDRITSTRSDVSEKWWTLVPSGAHKVHHSLAAADVVDVMRPDCVQNVNHARRSRDNPLPPPYKPEVR